MADYIRIFTIVLDNIRECRRLRKEYNYPDDPALDDIEALLYTAIKNVESGLQPSEDLRAIWRAMKELSV